MTKHQRYYRLLKQADQIVQLASIQHFTKLDYEWMANALINVVICQSRLNVYVGTHTYPRIWARDIVAVGESPCRTL